MPRIAQISDLHLQTAVPARQTQVEPILAAINEAQPDLVVVSGDVTDDGWEHIDELHWAKAWLDERINADWFAIPGNHDVGNFATMNAGRVTDARVKAWESVFGDTPGSPLSFTHQNKPGVWQVRGYNSMVFGSGNHYEQRQNKWLDQQNTSFERVEAEVTTYHAAFIHSPFFIQHPDEPQHAEANYWLGPGEARMACFKRLRAMGVRLIGSGHVHQTRLTTLDHTHITWAPPASGTWVVAPGLPNPPMPEKTGFLLHDLGEDGSVKTELIECAPMLKRYEHQPWP